MSSFFEKLKKGMEVEEPIKEEIEEPVEKKITKKTSRKIKKVEKEPIAKLTAKSEEQIKKLEIKSEPLEEAKEKAEEKLEEVKKEEKITFTKDDEGQLAIDVYQTDDDLIIQSAIAGVKPEDLDVSFEKDIIIIKGKREKPSKKEGDYFVQECYWGKFSREIVLPVEVDAGRSTAEMKEGVLTIKIPKILREKIKKIIVKG